MSPSFMKKTMVYLGLLDDEYDEYDDLEDRAPRGILGRDPGRPPVPGPGSGTGGGLQWRHEPGPHHSP